MAKLIASPEDIKQANALVSKMKESGMLKTKEAPVWVPKVILAEATRAEGEFFNDGRTVVFNKLCKGLENLEGQFLNIKGSGPVIQIAEAVAMREYPWKLDDGRTGVIKKGDRTIRAFAI